MLQQFDMFTRAPVEVVHNERNVREGDGRTWIRTESETAAMKAERLQLRAELSGDRYPDVASNGDTTGDLGGAYSEIERLRPRVRSQCKPTRAALVAHLDADDPVRLAAPCPFVSCEYHLHIDVGDGGISVFDLDGTHTCALDVAESDAASRSHDGLAEILGLTAEGVRQIEIDATATARANGAQLSTFAIEDEKAREQVRAERLVQIKKKPVADLDAIMGPRLLKPR